MTTTSETWAPPTEFAEDLKERYGLECPPRWGTPRNPARKSLGPKLWKVMEKLGAPPMPWQKYVTDVALELDENGVFVHREAGLSVSRQQGKTELILGLQVHRAMAWHRQNIIYAAQDRNMARQRWEDEFWEKISDSGLAKRARIRKSNGNEKILWPATRSRMGITANTESAGHGPALDLGIIDEAFKHEDDRLEQAFSPAMTTRPMAQLWWASAGGNTKSVWLNKKRAIGRALIEEAWKTGVWPGVCYFEWFAPEDMPRDDPATWYATLPALGHTVTEAVIAAELVKLDPAEFDRAYLNRTRKPTPPTDPNVPKAQWPGLVGEKWRPGGDVALAFDVSDARDYASIGVASLREDGRTHLELIDRRPGTEWLVPAVTRLTRLWRPLAVAVAGRSPAASLVDEMVAAGLRAPTLSDEPERGDLVVLRQGDMIEACGQIADAIRQGRVAHLDQPPLTGAVNDARTRRAGDAWTLDRRSSSRDISPLVAVTLAKWALAARAGAADDYDVADSFG
ncbi:terminase [Streptomyces sp. NRRL F-5123]|uniref:terminase n=1 Tax=Streptomyces sp. NRRL F-5123 TaxID=1463856 RepID=UPI0004E1E38D|nr:terminase [Streptomyces sp. NRRL F-5123]